MGQHFFMRFAVMPFLPKLLGTRALNIPRISVACFRFPSMLPSQPHCHHWITNWTCLELVCDPAPTSSMVWATHERSNGGDGLAKLLTVVSLVGCMCVCGFVRAFPQNFYVLLSMTSLSFSSSLSLSRLFSLPNPLPCPPPPLPHPLLSLSRSIYIYISLSLSRYLSLYVYINMPLSVSLSLSLSLFALPLSCCLSLSLYLSIFHPLDGFCLPMRKLTERSAIKTFETLVLVSIDGALS